MHTVLPKVKLITPSIKKALFVLLFILPCLLTKAQVSGTFTINSAQATAGNNFQTFTEAIFSLAGGVNGAVTFNVVPGSGPYNEQLNINAVAGASTTNKIVFNCNGTTITNASINSTARAVIKLDGAKHVTFDSAVILPVTTDNQTYGWGVGILRDADSNTIKRCKITVSNTIGQNTIGILIGGPDDYPNNNGLSGCDGNLVTGNTVVGGYWGIIIDNYAGNFAIPYTPVNNNVISNNKVSNFINSGVYLMWTKNTVVEGNDISCNMVESTAGITVNEKSEGVKLLSNRIHDFRKNPATTNSVDFFNGIKITYVPTDAANMNVVANNVIYDIRNDQSQYGIIVNNSSYVNFVHNTIVLDTAGAASSTTTSGFQNDGGNANINFKNNIVIVTRTGSGSKYGINVTSAGTAFASDYNDVVTGSNNFGRFGSTNYSTLATWQTGTLLDAHSASIDPAFTSLASGNLKPTAVALDNLGIYLNISTDIVGDPRNNNNPDAGAYEFLTPPCGSPFTGGAGIAIPSAFTCSAGNITLNLSGNSFGSGQNYQWQSSTTANGTYTNVGGSQVVPAFDIYPTTSLYYRAVLTCGSNTINSTPVLVNIFQPLSGNYTINPAQPLSLTNFNSFAGAYAAIKCGIGGPVTIEVAPNSGPYNEQLIIGKLNGASATNTLTIKGNGNTITYLSATTDERATIKLNNASHIILDSLNIVAQGSASSTYGYGVQLINNSDSNVIRKCTININKTSTSANFAGIVISSSATDAIGASGTATNCDYNNITGNTIIGGYYGITMYADPSLSKIFYDTISNNIVQDFYATGIYAYGTDHALIDGNDVSRPTRTNSGSTVNCIYLNNINTAAKVSNNKVHGTFTGFPAGTGATNGINLNNCDATVSTQNIISNNLLYDFGGTGALVGIFNTGSDHALCYHNTISLNNTTGTPTSTARGIYQTTAATGLEFRNNNVSITRTGTGTNVGIYMNTTGTSYTSNNNNFYIAGAGTNRVGSVGSTAQATLANWQTASGKDANSFAENPLFADLTNGNLKPTAPAIDNQGVSVGITTDITGLARSLTTPDIGCYEFAGVVPVKLSNIAAIKNGADILVKWTTISEINSQSFVIERSVDGSSFTTIGSVDAKGNTNGNEYYQFNDKDAANTTAKKLYYRLRMIDKDGHHDYSSIAAVQLGKNYAIVKAYPNPFITELYTVVSTDQKGTAMIDIKDITGRAILLRQQSIVPGDNKILVTGAETLNKGIYILTVTFNGNSYLFKITK